MKHQKKKRLNLAAMKVVNKTYYYFEEKEKGLFTDFLWQSHTKMSDFAELCGISLTLLSLVVNGKRSITKNIIEKFRENGFNIEL